MTPELLAQLKAIALDATPGPWVAKDVPGAGLEIYADVPKQLGLDPRMWPAFSTVNAEIKQNLVAYETWVQFPTEKLENVQARNALFIATANPTAVLELIAESELLNDLRDAFARAEGIASKSSKIDRLRLIGRLIDGFTDRLRVPVVK